jgi:hypothetical protein
MAFFYMLSDPQMNYTLNRPLADGEATSRIAEARALAPNIKDIDTWTATFLDAAKKAEKENRWLDAAAYHHSQFWSRAFSSWNTHSGLSWASCPF